MDKELIHKTKFECIKFKLTDSEGKTRDSINILREEFVKELENKIYHYWIDLTDIKIVTSIFIGTIAFMSTLIKDKGEIVIFGSNENVKKIIEVTGILKLPNIIMATKDTV